MSINFNSNSVVVFDLDDTLYPEISFLTSAFLEIATGLELRFGVSCYERMLQAYQDGERDVFSLIRSEFGLRDRVTTEELLTQYRTHRPSISLFDGALELLRALEDAHIPLGLITDGRSVTQRNKIEALGLSSTFDPIVISEEIGTSKPAEQNFLSIEQRWPGRKYYYIADNPKKDFVTPNRLGWTSICALNQGTNVHPQDFTYPQAYLPQIKINSLRELLHHEFSTMK